MDRQTSTKQNALYVKPTEYEPIPMVAVESFESKLDNNSFDPSKFSPPNDFMNKLMACFETLYSNKFTSPNRRKSYRVDPDFLPLYPT